MRLMNFRLHVSIGLLGLLIIGGLAGPARAATGEARVYLDVEHMLPHRAAGSLHLTLRPFISVESRFRNSGLVYEQWNAGLRFGLLSWLSGAAYYTPREALSSAKPDAFKNVAGADVVFQPSFGSFRFINREANEWHVTDRYYRYRNLSEIVYTTPIRRMSLYLYDEFRVDSDEKRVNMNNVEGGIKADVTPSLTLVASYGIEANRRRLPRWEYVQFVGLKCAAHS